jgi:hypothetical protein
MLVATDPYAMFIHSTERSLCIGFACQRRSAIPLCRELVVSWDAFTVFVGVCHQLLCLARPTESRRARTRAPPLFCTNAAGRSRPVRHDDFVPQSRKVAGDPFALRGRLEQNTRPTAVGKIFGECFRMRNSLYSPSSVKMQT